MTAGNQNIGITADESSDDNTMSFVRPVWLYLTRNLSNATQNLTSPIKLTNDMMIRAFTYNNSASATLNMNQAITITNGATLLLDGMDNASVQGTEVKFVNNTSGSAIIVEEGGTVRVGAVILSSSEDNSSPFISSTGGTVIIECNPTFIAFHDTNEALPSEDTYSSGADNQTKTSVNTSTTLIEAKGGTEVEIKGGDITATSEEPLIKFEGEGNSVTLSGGNISGTEGPALTIPKGVTLVIPEDSTAEVTTQAADKQAIDLAGGATVQKGDIEITVSEENDEAGDNYVDNYGNIILAANPSEDGEGTVNAAKIILADGTTIDGTEEDSLQITYEDDEETDETVTQVTVPAGGSVTIADEGTKTWNNGGSVSSTGGETKVKETTIPATGITLDKTSVTLYSNTTPNTVTLTATVTPDNSTDTVQWASSDTSVATVDANGNVNAVANGTATITATAGSCSATCTVTVKTYSSGGGGSSSSTYTVTVDSAKNGTVTVSPKSASKGTTVTITVTPDSGYELDDLTVTDKNGDTVKLTRKSDTQYTFTMPASRVTVSAAFKEADAESDSPSKSFADVDTSSYYYDAVEWAVENGITNGTSATAFSPDATCTRAQMVTFLWRAAGSPAPESSVNTFEDVKSGEYYYDAVLWAVEKGITEGTSATTFSPDDTVTRGQTVTFLYRAASSPASSDGSFADVAADAYYAPAVQWAVANGITNGTSSTTFSPDASCTRAQIVTFLYRDMAE